MPHPFVDLGNPIIAALGSPAALVLRRRAPGAYDGNGVWVPGAEVLSPLDAVVQPLRPRELLQLPENERTSEGIEIFTREALRTSDVNQSIESDRVDWSGRTWRVVLVEDWVKQARYARAVAVRVGV